MVSAKAWTGGLTAAAATVLLYFLDQWPVIGHMPPDVHSALELLIVGGLTAAAVWHVPNRQGDA